MKYRLYTFVNHIYMSEKQYGIQTAHIVSTMWNEADDQRNKGWHSWHQAMKQWCPEPTIIMCEGGNVAMLTDLYARLELLAEDLDLPCVSFHEDEESLGGVITCVGVLVPEVLFECYTSGYTTYDIGHPSQPPVIVRELNIQRADSSMVQPNTTEHAFLSIIKTAKLA